MPIYEYQRPDGSTFEIVQSFSDDPLTRDPETGVSVERVLHAPAVHFKGKGFYNTDYGTRKRQRENAAAASANGSKDSERLEGFRRREGLLRLGDRGEAPSRAPRSRREGQSTPARTARQELARQAARGEAARSGRAGRPQPTGELAAGAQPLMNARDAARRSDSQTVSPVSPSGRVRSARSARARAWAAFPMSASAANRPEQCRAAHVGDDRRRRVPRDPGQAEEARRGQQRALHVREQRLLMFLALNVRLVGRAQVLARARERQCLLCR